MTGAAGYLGGRVATALGAAARAVVRTAVPWLPQRQQVECDLLAPPGELVPVLEGAGAVVHLAGHNEVIAAADPVRAIDETVAMARNVLEAARAAGIGRIVYVSTVHVYGEQLRPGARLHEDLDAAPVSPYARARHRCEDLFRSDDHVDAVVLRLTNAVGAAADPSVDRWTLVASDLCRSAVLDRTMVLRSTGQQWRDFIALEDACRLVIATVEAPVPAGVYNLAAGRSATVRSLAELIRDRVELACGWRPELHAPEPRGEPGEPYVVVPDRLAGHGLRAELSLEDGVDDIIDHCRKHHAVLRAH